MVTYSSGIPHFDMSTFAKTSAVGLDDFFERIYKNFDTTPKSNYPPYNIKKTGPNSYVVELAVAGFNTEEITVELVENELLIKGVVQKPDASEYIYKGLADRNFTRKFTLADSVEVKSADLTNGILRISLERLETVSKARRIPIGTVSEGSVGEETKEEVSAPQLLTETKKTSQEKKAA
jgi:molecular chaperone IbpA